MSKPKDPVIAVITYFETADVALAQQTLAIAQTIVKRRQPRAAAKPKPSSTVFKGKAATESAAS